METGKLKRFAQFARRSLIEQVSAKLVSVLNESSVARREKPKATRELDEAIVRDGYEQLIKHVAYTWFNRFCALRFMDVNRYTRIRVVSPAEGQFQPEILAEAKMGHVDEEMFGEGLRGRVFALLESKAANRDPQGKAYRLLVVGACNYWHRAMPFLFEQINDYTELLIPDDLLSGNSILAYTREAMTPDTCKDVEVIGWLYQFYISEEKDEVFAGLKKNKKITPENIPAVTQLFTPRWIARYLVENSLGRLWMLNRPGSRLAEHMDYYIKPQELLHVAKEDKESDFLHINKPEEIKICDPACGSGHMLVCAFDLLHLMYEEEGYEPAKIPEKILTHNLYGIEIDKRAGGLAALALVMKACKKQQRLFLSKPVQPNICVLENVHFEEGELGKYMDSVGRELFALPLLNTLCQFEEANNFGSLIRPDVTDVAGVSEMLESKNVSGDLLLSSTHPKVLQVLRQADYLNPKYHIVITNPPYMGARNMNQSLKRGLKDNYSDSKNDLYAAFIENNIHLTRSGGTVAMITMQNWMFLSSFEVLRAKILTEQTIVSMAHLGARAFDNIGGEVVSTTAFVLEKSSRQEYEGVYLRLTGGSSEVEKETAMRQAIQNPDCGLLFKAKSDDFLGVVGKPIAYWISDNLRALFRDGRTIGCFSDSKLGLSTADTAQFLRLWYEVGFSNISADLSRDDIKKANNAKWIPHQKGGTFRRWYGNNEWVINWENNGEEIRKFGTESGGKPRSAVRNPDFFFRPGITWSDVATKYAGRYFGAGFIFDVASPALFPKKTTSVWELNSYVNSVVFQRFLDVTLSGIHYNNGTVARMPCIISMAATSCSENLSKNAVQISKNDWDSRETSWDFTSLPLLRPDYQQSSLKAAYETLRKFWKEMTLEMQRLEEENNRIFIEACDLQDELTHEVPLSEITLTCNPHYRYGSNKSEEELEAMLLADTIRELISYAVGCMFGRYALEKPGLILANQGETIEDYLKQVPNPCFPADDDNVIPILDDDWFTDDIAGRFRIFLRVAFGEENYEENLSFVETALGKNGKPKDIRSYFLRDFYSDHVKRYKKRPIYWLFSSRSGSFNALVYMHRYRADTVSVVLNDYLREFRTKLVSHKNQMEAVSISVSASQAEKSKAFKEVEKVRKMITETEEYEREVLYPLATQRIGIDLDDGVRFNYAKLGMALKNIPGLSANNW